MPPYIIVCVGRSKAFIIYHGITKSYHSGLIFLSMYVPHPWHFWQNNNMQRGVTQVNHITLLNFGGNYTPCLIWLTNKWSNMRWSANVILSSSLPGIHYMLYCQGPTMHQQYLAIASIPILDAHTSARDKINSLFACLNYCSMVCYILL